MQLSDVPSNSQTHYVDSAANKRRLVFDANKKGEEKENGKGKRIEFMKEDAIFCTPQFHTGHLFTSL